MNQQSRSHLEPEELAAYLEGRLAPADREWVESHLAGCDDCRSDAVGAFRSIQDGESRSRPRWPPLTLAAAAVAALVIGGNAVFERGRSEAPAPFRSGADAADFDQVGEIDIVSPVEGRLVAGEGVVFVWRAESADSFYRLTLMDGAGDVLWRTSTTDTTAAPGPDVALRAGETYFWIVDALASGGRTATSGAHSFRLADEP